MGQDTGQRTPGNPRYSNSHGGGDNTGQRQFRRVMPHHVQPNSGQRTTPGADHLSGHAPNDGQHRDQIPGASSEEYGQRSRMTPGANVGHGPGGFVGNETSSDSHRNVPIAERGADIETTRGPAAGAPGLGSRLPHAATHPDEDDTRGTDGGP